MNPLVISDKAASLTMMYEKRYYKCLIFAILLLIIASGCRYFEEEYQIEDEIIAIDFDLEGNLEGILNLLEEVNIQDVIDIRYRGKAGPNAVMLEITAENNNEYRLSLLSEEPRSIWDIMDISTNTYIYKSYESSFNIIKEVSDFSDFTIRSIMRTLRDQNIGEIVYAQIIENDMPRDIITMEIENEDNRFYLLILTGSGLRVIEDVETGEIIFRLYNIIIQ